MHKATKYLALFLLVWFVGSSVRGSDIKPDREYVRAKSQQVVPDRAIDYLSRNLINDQARIWVFFTDKGIYNQEDFTTAQKRAEGIVSPRSMARRAKHGITELKFTDLPVVSNYTEQVVATGAKLRRVSKWLNAASFEVSLNKLETISALSFVAKIQPVALYTKEYMQPDQPIDQVPDKLEQKSRLDINSLDYGSSYWQLNQISVPICHDSGYTGQGVIISMFDTGFRKLHETFDSAYIDSRVLAEWDFVFNDDNVSNEDIDWSSAWNHGTSTWSVTGGNSPGIHYGPAFHASFILCKTEDVRSETQVEEDNWESAMEWVDSIGTDIISSSLSYTQWYTASDYNGDICVTTIAADLAAEYGILVCNSAGNAGPSPSSLGAPADADSILTVGSVTSLGTISSFSSRGPTYDGRTKPEICAQGSSTYLARASSLIAYGTGSGTSFSCPLIAGVSGVVMSAHPEWTNMEVREAIMMTADNADTPDNTYGWGIANTWDAIHYLIYTAGDADGSKKVTIADAVYLLAYIFNDGPAPDPIEAGDADGNGQIEVSDVLYILDYIFGGGPKPQKP